VLFSLVVKAKARSKRDSTRRAFSPWRVALGLSVIGMAATCLAFAGRAHWLLEWFSHFHVQYLLCLLPFAIAFAIGRKFVLATLCTVFVLVNLAVVLPIYWGASGAKDDKGFRLLLLNINSANREHACVLDTIERTNPDLILAMEVNERWLKALSTVGESYPYWASRPRSDNFGIAFFSRLSGEIDIRRVGSSVPTVVACLETRRGPIIVIGTHTMPPVNGELATERNNQLQALARLAKAQQDPVLLTGDLNLSPWSPYFSDLLEQSGLRDARRGFGLQTTWPDGVFFLRVPIDHCLHSEEFTVSSFAAGESIGSDHFPVVVDLALKP